MPPRLYAATRKGLFIIERKLGRWSISSVSFLGLNLPIVYPNKAVGTVWASISHGHFGNKLHRSGDRGKTWEECAVPAYPPLAEGEKPLVDAMGRTIPAALQMIWSLQVGGPDQPGRLWAGTIPGGLFRSDDSGTSWQLVQSLWDQPDRKKWMGGGADYPGIHSICVDPRDSRSVLVGVSSGGAWHTADDGNTWTVRSHGMRCEYMPPEQAGDPVAQDPHLVTRCPSKPDFLWCQHHNGIFRSVDDARSWQEIVPKGPSAFGFPVVVHPKDPQTAWFVPAVKDETRIPAQGKVVVSRTRDGGKTFAVLKKGLPQKNAYDLTYRHALDIDATGKTLAFGSTTGSLWVSDDQGDSWQTVGEHLPPVYCVRFEK